MNDTLSKAVRHDHNGNALESVPDFNQIAHQKRVDPVDSITISDA